MTHTHTKTLTAEVSASQSREARTQNTVRCVSVHKTLSTVARLLTHLLPPIVVVVGGGGVGGDAVASLSRLENVVRLANLQRARLHHCNDPTHTPHVQHFGSYAVISYSGGCA